MIPYKDDNPTYSFPFFTVLIIGLNVGIYIVQVSTGNTEMFAYLYGAIPSSLLTFNSDQPVHPAITVFTSMFLHGSFFHLAGNMLYLWIFGNNIEDTLGHLRFLFFYLLGGVFAAYSHAVIEGTSSTIPMIGASGAISAVLGAYLFLYPHARVHTIVFFGFFVQVIRIPALIVIGFWAIIQIVNGLLSAGFAQHGGVAWFAHIGGFLYGLVTIRLWRPKRRYIIRW